MPCITINFDCVFFHVVLSESFSINRKGAAQTNQKLNRHNRIYENNAAPVYF